MSFYQLIFYSVPLKELPSVGAFYLACRSSASKCLFSSERQELLICVETGSLWCTCKFLHGISFFLFLIFCIHFTVLISISRKKKEFHFFFLLNDSGAGKSGCFVIFKFQRVRILCFLFPHLNSHHGSCRFILRSHATQGPPSCSDKTIHFVWI